MVNKSLIFSLDDLQPLLKALILLLLIFNLDGRPVIIHGFIIVRFVLALGHDIGDALLVVLSRSSTLDIGHIYCFWDVVLV